MDEISVLNQILMQLQQQTSLLQKQTATIQALTTAVAGQGQIALLAELKTTHNDIQNDSSKSLASIDAGFIAMATGFAGVNDKLNKIITALTPQLDHVEIKFSQPTKN